MGAIPAAIQAKLLRSGHYRAAPGGRILSRHFPSVEPHPTKPLIHVTPFRAGTAADIKEGSHPVYRSEIERADGSRPLHSGLEYCVRIEEPGCPPIYIVDNHHLSYFAWHEALALGYIRLGAILIHIDKHADMSSPPEWSTTNRLAQAANINTENKL